MGLTSYKNKRSSNGLPWDKKVSRYFFITLYGLFLILYFVTSSFHYSFFYWKSLIKVFLQQQITVQIWYIFCSMTRIAFLPKNVLLWLKKSLQNCSVGAVIVWRKSRGGMKLLLCTGFVSQESTHVVRHN